MKYKAINGPMEIVGDGTHWTVYFGFKTTWGRESDWYPSLRLAKKTAAECYKHHCSSLRRPAPKIIQWAIAVHQAAGG